MLRLPLPKILHCHYCTSTNTSTSVVTILNALSAHVHSHSKRNLVFGDSTSSGIPFHVCICFLQGCCIYTQAVDWKACAKWIELPPNAHADLEQLFEFGVKDLKFPCFITDHMILTCELLATPFSQYLFGLSRFEKIQKSQIGYILGFRVTNIVACS